MVLMSRYADGCCSMLPVSNVVDAGRSRKLRCRSTASASVEAVLLGAGVGKAAAGELNRFAALMWYR